VRLCRGRAVRPRLEHEEFRLHARFHRVPDRRCPVDHSLQHPARIALERISVRCVDIADETGNPALLVAPWKDLKGAEVGHQQHVGFLDADEPFDRGAIEHDIPSQGLLEL
jgi:hypothetical protein